ncbi:NADPH:quinone reductase [Nocardia sp. NPDC051052]|uniref:NADPH:quinone reductase n=1 Tax=Nocardia sp. NPDC051052 TaxID=3364322 RepID=UPI0037BA0841
MRAAYIEELGPAENIRFGDLPDPTPGRDEVLVRVSATTVNRVDTLIRSGRYVTPIDFPFVIGRDLVGNVAESNSENFLPGDQVWCNSLGHDRRQGAAAEFAVVPAERLYHLPPGASPTDILAVAHPAATAHLAAFARGKLAFGETVLIGGAAGSVGGALVTLIANAGGIVIATAHPRDHVYCLGLGATHAVDYHRTDMVEQIMKLGPRGIDLYIDTSGGNDLSSAVEVLAPTGRIVLLAGPDTQPTLPAGQFYMKDATICGFVISRATVVELKEAASVINRYVLDLSFRPRAVELLPLSEAAKAHRRIESENLHGTRLLLEI